MAAARTSIHGEWTNKLAFVLAATGSAVGLGNIWRFPYVAGESGGSAFVLIYLICVLGVGLPVMMAEIMLGRRGRQSPINTMRTLAEEEGRSPAWQGLGWLGMLAGFMILSFYSVVAGWTLSYIERAASGDFVGIDAAGAGAAFNGFLANPGTLLFWHSVFMALTLVVVARGVQGGLEKAVRYLMPSLFILLLGMAIYAGVTANFSGALEYLFKPDFSKVTPSVVLAALGQAFFSLSLGMGAIMAYGSYLPHDASIPRTAATIVLLDTLVALVAGLAIFPFVFDSGLTASEGPGLIFVSLPVAFGQMPGGVVVGTAFFILLMFAAWTSAISLLEPFVAWLVENRGMRRLPAALIAGGAAWVFGIASLLSLNLWSSFTIFGKNIFDTLDYLTSNIMLPLGGLLISVFAAWVLPHDAARTELGLHEGRGFAVWRSLVRFVTPVAIALIFLNVTGLLGLIEGD